mmetsp:Transcript_90653/g.293446  ORF Transcript_90653/g.293446 Transcript_90653/m.293446 type:complete len:278 (+) Transcript_90653:1035-1868(+)
MHMQANPIKVYLSHCPKPMIPGCNTANARYMLQGTLGLSVVVPCPSSTSASASSSVGPLISPLSSCTLPLSMPPTPLMNSWRSPGVANIASTHNAAKATQTCVMWSENMPPHSSFWLPQSALPNMWSLPRGVVTSIPLSGITMCPQGLIQPRKQGTCRVASLPHSSPGSPLPDTPGCLPAPCCHHSGTCWLAGRWSPSCSPTSGHRVSTDWSTWSPADSSSPPSSSAAPCHQGGTRVSTSWPALLLADSSSSPSSFAEAFHQSGSRRCMVSRPAFIG